MHGFALALISSACLVGCGSLDGIENDSLSQVPPPVATPAPASAPSPPRPADTRGANDSTPLTNVVDFDTLRLGGVIVGPVGPEVETSVISNAGEAIADIRTRVVCPATLATCNPMRNPAGTVYTYVAEITPGADLANDAGFFMPGVLRAIASAETVRTDYATTGFTGSVGYSFRQLRAAVNGEADVRGTRVVCDFSGRIAWYLPFDSGWGTGEAITFFWQSTQPPIGPNGQWLVEAIAQAGTPRAVSGRGTTTKPRDVAGQAPTASDCSPRT